MGIGFSGTSVSANNVEAAGGGKGRKKSWNPWTPSGSGQPGKIAEESLDECPICLEIMECEISSQGHSSESPKQSIPRLALTSCGHRFHLTCLEAWFNRTKGRKCYCPYCMRIIVRKDLMILPTGKACEENTILPVRRSARLIAEAGNPPVVPPRPQAPVRIDAQIQQPRPVLPVVGVESGPHPQPQRLPVGAQLNLPRLSVRMDVMNVLFQPPALRGPPNPDPLLSGQQRQPQPAPVPLIATRVQQNLPAPAARTRRSIMNALLPSPQPMRRQHRQPQLSGVQQVQPNPQRAARMSAEFHPLPPPVRVQSRPRSPVPRQPQPPGRVQRNVNVLVPTRMNAQLNPLPAPGLVAQPPPTEALRIQPHRSARAKHPHGRR